VVLQLPAPMRQPIEFWIEFWGQTPNSEWAAIGGCIIVGCWISKPKQPAMMQLPIDPVTEFGVCPQNSVYCLLRRWNNERGSDNRSENGKAVVDSGGVKRISLLEFFAGNCATFRRKAIF